ncbi:MAG: DUF2213 domain-containing protein [Methylococcaceae bacterium]|nr:DUF2213 domain-containing protein [Methylococcaceae bacterium]
MTYYGTKLSDNITETPEGFLICHDVIIARTGTQDYAPFEVPVKAKTNMVTIHRQKDEVLRDETLASFEGKPVTAGHPEGFVTPDNWNDLAMGFVKNVRPHEEGDDGYIMADLYITNSKAIRAVRDGLREVSCGYEADYTDLENGEGKQTNILGNHVALVPKGRCGEKCSIQDAQSQQGGIMTIKDKVIDALSKIFDASESTEEEVMEDAEVETPESEAKEFSKLDELGAKLDKLIELMSKAVEAETMEDTAEEVVEDKCDEVVEDAEPTIDADTIARAEIIAPGIAKDEDADLVTDSLRLFGMTSEGAETLKAFAGMTPDHKFVAVSELLKVKRNATMMRPMGDSLPSQKATAEDLNKKYADFWATKK